MAPSNGADVVCGQSITCMHSSEPIPHLELRRRLLDDTPHRGRQTRIRMWVVYFEDAD